MARPSEAAAAAAADEITLDDIRARLAPHIAAAAAFDGWTDAALDIAARDAGIDAAVARFAFPDGAMQMIAAWVGTVDRRMVEAFPPERIGALKVREKIRALVQFRLDCAGEVEEAVRRALAIQAMPQNVPAALRQGWNSADLMWRLAGDTAADYNHYTKRMTLAGIYGATLAVFVGDESEGKADTRAFLDRRIDGVMKFETAKARLLQDREGFSMTRFLGRLRYPAR